ncbi:DSD1 family PLP-dependent enzyme [Candidimonas sp. SYP-B2681]|uniref:DSD1 family PLP-dependent enzyme n=1 Tax=Candidimonas sp. SYP-B2681 TaxID=2497686 RepID=UPI000F880B44|nr:DSD1 family PLP-dependent enzyme [Candidimonas sp. SYP-B2681]RTZ45757.1 DSD1 family PLP-dependent enzyme [Candidimonas sp. SYP-B2681]
MSPWKAANVGDHVNTIDTPALLLDMDAFEHNLNRMMSALDRHGVRLRPHAKSHKCPQIALRQIALGAVGICCQKVSEAAVFVEAGVNNVLITNEIVGQTKLKHLMDLAAKAQIGVLVDHASQIDALAKAAHLRGVTLDVYVEVNVGANRCGVSPGLAAYELAEQISSTENLRFAGLHCYQGTAQHMRLPTQRAQAIAAAAQAALDTRTLIEARGIPVQTITGAGTGTFMLERDSGIYTELQAGSYIFMDSDYGRNELSENEVSFQNSLFVLTTVMSRPSEEQAIVDAGLKASSVDSGMPIVWQRDDLQYVKASDEHGVIATPDGDSLSLESRLMLIPGHCDPTVNLYDDIICVRGEVVEAVWPISARGALL